MAKKLWVDKADFTVERLPMLAFYIAVHSAKMLLQFSCQITLLCTCVIGSRLWFANTERSVKCKCIDMLNIGTICC